MSPEGCKCTSACMSRDRSKARASRRTIVEPQTTSIYFSSLSTLLLQYTTMILSAATEARAFLFLRLGWLVGGGELHPC